MTDVSRTVFKVVLCGDYGVGKSSLFRRYVYDTFVQDAHRRSTIGFDHYEKTYSIDGESVTLQLWDTGGLERVATVTSGYFKFSNGVILVFAFDDADSFNSLPQHLLEAITSSERARFFLCGNKLDLCVCPSAVCTGVTDAQVQQFYEENQAAGEKLFRKLYKVSCKTKQGVDEMFEDIARQLSLSCPKHQPDPDKFILRPESKPSSCCSYE